MSFVQSKVMYNMLIILNISLIIVHCREKGKIYHKIKNHLN